MDINERLRGTEITENSRTKEMSLHENIAAVSHCVEVLTTITF